MIRVFGHRDDGLLFGGEDVDLAGESVLVGVELGVGHGFALNQRLARR
jgi:hypothetical protein